MKKSKFIILATCLGLAGLVVALQSKTETNTTTAKDVQRPALKSIEPQAVVRNFGKVSEGKVTGARIEVGPFDLHRRYGSMQGPYTQIKVSVGDLLAAGKISVPESGISFLEQSGNGDGPSMSGSANSTFVKRVDAPIIGLEKVARQPRQFLWFKGVKLQVLDENNHPMPTGEFFCHFNIEVKPRFRRAEFPNGENHCVRLITLTQGQTEFQFPDGFAVPVSSDERWSFAFQAINRTTDAHRRVKQLLTLEFIKDADLSKPVEALAWDYPTIVVKTDQSTPATDQHGPDCMMPLADGETVRKSSEWTMRNGTRVSGHFVVPPGTHEYQTEISETSPDFATVDRKIIACLMHVHPFCREVSLVECSGDGEKPLFTAHIQTKEQPGLQLMHIDDIMRPDGIQMHADRKFAVKAIYDNTTGVPQDAMVTLGVFTQDYTFKKPDWAMNAVVASNENTRHEEAGSITKESDLYCGVKGPEQSKSQAADDATSAPRSSARSNGLAKGL